jgi:hypothetical protein
MTFQPFQETPVPGPKRDFAGYGRRVPRALAGRCQGRGQPRAEL